MTDTNAVTTQTTEKCPLQERFEKVTLLTPKLKMEWNKGWQRPEAVTTISFEIRSTESYDVDRNQLWRLERIAAEGHVVNITLETLQLFLPERPSPFKGDGLHPEDKKEAEERIEQGR